MIHKITIEIESEKEWSAVCALSSLLKTPLSEIAKKDFLEQARSIAKGLSEDPVLVKEVSISGNGKNAENIKKLLTILNSTFKSSLRRNEYEM